jgi:hypothetical protein
LIIASSAIIASQGGGALEWKNYVIRYDRGWDILCEPYEVQPNDWLIKIFSQKGEIAHEDFREFTSIFKRLNPHVTDIDRIRPGQIIDIPLKKLPQGTLPGQSSGIVTIPFVTLNNVDEILTDYSTEYTIRPGDCVSLILARRFGTYGSNSYEKGLRMFQALNPKIKNVNRIFAGQKIYVPAPSIQEQSWYASMFDSQGNLTDKVGMVSSEVSQNPPVGKSTILPSNKQNSSITDKTSLSQAATALEGKLLDKGTFFFPLKTGNDFELDLSRYPMLEKNNGKRYILTAEDKIMGEDIGLLKTMLSDVTIVKISKQDSTDQIIDELTKNQDSKLNHKSINLIEYGTEISIQAKWVETIESQQDDVPRRLCIIPINSPTERTAPSICRYLTRHNIILKEVLSNSKGVISAEAPATNRSAKYTIVTSIGAEDKNQFVSEFAQTMQWHYAQNISISFPYEDIQIEALSNMLSSGQGQEVLIDFENIYGDAISAIEKTGLKVIQIKKQDSPATIVSKLLSAMNVKYVENPAFMAARRFSPYNISVKIKGYLLNNLKTEKILLSTNSLNQQVIEFLESTGLRVIMLGKSKLFY